MSSILPPITRGLKHDVDLPIISQVLSCSSGEDLTPEDNPSGHVKDGDLVTTRTRGLATAQDVEHTKQIMENYAGQSLPSAVSDDESKSLDELVDILPCLNPKEPPEFEYPLCDCFCCEVYWAPYFAKVMKRVFHLKMKYRSKKGTASYRNRKPKKKSKLAKSMGDMAEGVRRKSVMVKEAISREWKDRRPMWTYQDTAIQEMELELQRLRRQIRDASSFLPTSSGGGYTGYQTGSHQYSTTIPQHLVGIPQHLLGVPPYLVGPISEEQTGTQNTQPIQVVSAQPSGSVRSVTWHNANKNGIVQRRR